MLSRREGGEVLQFALLSRYRHVSLSCEQSVAPIAQLGERQTEDLKVPGSIPGLGICFVMCQLFPHTVAAHVNIGMRLRE